MANGNGPFTGPPWPHITAIPPGAPARHPGESDASYDQRFNAWIAAGAPGSSDHGNQINPPINPPPSIGPIPNPIAGVNNVADFLKALSSGNTWLRVGEVAAGLVILGIGLDVVFKMGLTKKATKLVK